MAVIACEYADPNDPISGNPVPVAPLPHTAIAAIWQGRQFLDAQQFDDLAM